MDNKKLKSSWAAAFTVASVWFGTHVGAGFATGNQVVNYFVQYGWTAAIFPLLAMGILAVVMYIMMKFAKLSGFDNYKDTYRALYPKPWMEVFFEIFYIIIILAAVASCVDGAGGIVKSLINLPDIICNLVIIALLILLSIFGVDLIIKASTVLSTAILIVTAILVIMGFVVPIDAVAQELVTGLAYSDVKNLTTDHLQTFFDGNLWIITRRKKTNTESNIRLLDVPKRIIEKYKGLARDGHVFPVPSNGSCNKILKEIGRQCGFKVRLTYHVARHTNATTVLLSHGVPIETVSRLLGHTNIKTTQIYAKITAQKISQDMETLSHKLEDMEKNICRAI